jgi:hypothetical protein
MRPYGGERLRIYHMERVISDRCLSKSDDQSMPLVSKKNKRMRED